MKSNDSHGNRFVDMTGQTIGYAHVDGFHHGSKSRSYWECTCLICGNKFVRSRTRLLLHPEDANCGCLSKIKSVEAIRNKSIKGHEYGVEINSVYQGMLKRCYSKYCHGYERYGGRGIGVCDEWRNDKWNFYKWSIANGYSPGLTLDRIDNNIGYSPDNCRWITNKQQQNNKHDNRRVEYKGETYTVSELAEHLGIPYSTMLARVKSKTYNLPLDSPVKNTWGNRKRRDG